MNAKLGDFMTANRPRMVKLAYGWCQRHDQAEDAVQESARRVLASWSHFDGVSEIEPWFVRIMRNVCLDGFKRKDTPDVLAADSDGFLVFNDVVDAREKMAIDFMVSGEDAARVRLTLDSMPRRMRRVLRRIDMEGLDYADAARALGWPQGTVKSALHRARAVFRRNWKRMDGGHDEQR